MTLSEPTPNGVIQWEIQHILLGICIVVNLSSKERRVMGKDHYEKLLKQQI